MILQIILNEFSKMARCIPLGIFFIYHKTCCILNCDIMNSTGTLGTKFVCNDFVDCSKFLQQNGQMYPTKQINWFSLLILIFWSHTCRWQRQGTFLYESPKGIVVATYIHRWYYTLEVKKSKLQCKLRPDRPKKKLTMSTWLLAFLNPW